MSVGLRSRRMQVRLLSWGPVLDLPVWRNLVVSLASEVSAFGRVGSSPTTGTTIKEHAMDIETEFTESEKEGVERIWGKKWHDLSEAGKLMRGLIYRKVWSPEAIANMIVGEPK